MSVSQIAALEVRRLLAGTIEDRVLIYEATNADETIVVSGSGAQVTVTVNGNQESFPSADISRIHINARGGDDLITYNLGRTCTLAGGSGNDTITTTGADTTMFGGAGDDSLTGGTGFNHYFPDRDSKNGPTQAGDDTMIGTASNEIYYSDAGSDVIEAGGGPDDGGARDWLYYTRRTAALRLTLDGIANDGAPSETGNFSGIEMLFGGSGNDFIDVGDIAIESVDGGAGDDVIVGSPGEDELAGGEGNDTLVGHAGFDTLHGGNGNDRICGGAGDDRIDGNQGKNHLYGKGGDDSIHTSGTSSDEEANYVVGGSGNDRLVTSDPHTTLKGQSGNDGLVFVFSSASNPTAAVLDGGSGYDHFHFYSDYSEDDSFRISTDDQANDGRRGTNDMANVRFVEFFL
ncbi:MAG TPA: calcium-binding protein, partial [Tepidisphaeraceae bacterium]|nr:calcium-binding protein [Tepidisphaeraceae bacterium]